MNADNVSKPRARVVDCIVVTSEIRNNDSGNKDDRPGTESPKKEKHAPKPIPDYTVTVKSRVLLINREMALDKMPYRYDVKTRDGKLQIDLLVLDSHGDVALQHTKEVTPDNYKAILDNMRSGIGFLFDD